MLKSKTECKQEAKAKHFGIHFVKRDRWIKNCNEASPINAVLLIRIVSSSVPTEETTDRRELVLP
jgi:hypothetical protein